MPRNGSVFRRYMGGALMRRRDPNSPCMGPKPGQGHWEHQKGAECPRCVPVEEEVSAYLSERMYFRCVQIADLELRNHLEMALIATVAQCQVCRPSGTWLGKYAYPGQVWSTGLWNAQHTGRSVPGLALTEFLDDSYVEPGNLSHGCLPKFLA